MSVVVVVAFAFAGSCGLLLGCAGAEGGEGNIGDPCELEEHCADGLICDIHGEHGSCQQPHGH